MSRIEMVHADETLRAGICRNLVITAWFGPPEVHHVRALSRALQTAAGRYDGQQGLLDLAISGTPRFDEPTREALLRVVRDKRLQGVAGAHVVGLGGVAGATVRAVLSTIMLVGRISTPTRIFGELAPAAAWLAPLLSIPREAWTPADVVAVATELTAKAPVVAGG